MISPESYIGEDRDVFEIPKPSKTLSQTDGSNMLSCDSSATSLQLESSASRLNGQDTALQCITEVNGTNIHRKIELVKTWSLNTFKCTKQAIEEKLGTTLPTTDEKLDLRIECLRQMQKQYRILLDRVRAFTIQFGKTIESQRQLGLHMAYMSQQQLELTAEFTHNATTQRVVAENGEKVIGALNTFSDALHTLVEHTFTDTLLTIKHMNSARLEYDVYRKDAEAARLRLVNASPNEGSPGRRRAEAASARFEACHQTFVQLKAAVDTKLRLLHENRIRVMQSQLLLLHNATSAYFSGNSRKLDQTLREYSIRSRSIQATGVTSWLEKPAMSPAVASASERPSGETQSVGQADVVHDKVNGDSTAT